MQKRARGGYVFTFRRHHTHTTSFQHCHAHTTSLAFKSELEVVPFSLFDNTTPAPPPFDDTMLRALYTPPPIPTGLLESYRTGLGLGQISCWLITIQTLSPSPSGVLVNSYWNDPKSQGIADS